MPSEVNLGGQEKKNKVCKPAGNGDELNGYEKFPQSLVCSRGAKRQRQIEQENGIVYEDGPTDERNLVVEVTAVRQDKHGLWIPCRDVAEGGDSVGQQVGRKQEQHP